MHIRSTKSWSNLRSKLKQAPSSNRWRKRGKKKERRKFRNRIRPCDFDFRSKVFIVVKIYDYFRFLFAGSICIAVSRAPRNSSTPTIVSCDFQKDRIAFSENCFRNSEFVRNSSCKVILKVPKRVFEPFLDH